MGVSRATGVEAASRSKEGAYCILIHSDYAEEEEADCAINLFNKLFMHRCNSWFATFSLCFFATTTRSNPCSCCCCNLNASLATRLNRFLSTAFGRLCLLVTKPIRAIVSEFNRQYSAKCFPKKRWRALKTWSKSALFLR